MHILRESFECALSGALAGGGGCEISRKVQKRPRASQEHGGVYMQL